MKKKPEDILQGSVERSENQKFQYEFNSPRDCYIVSNVTDPSDIRRYEVFVKGGYIVWCTCPQVKYRCGGRGGDACKHILFISKETGLPISDLEKYYPNFN